VQWLMLLGQLNAHAFCGTYVSSAGTEVYNSASEVVIVRQGQRTTLTMANDVRGDPSNFAMVVPVPQVVREDDVHVVSPDDIDLARDYSMPRLVSYTCADFAPYWQHPCPWMETSCIALQHGDTGDWAGSASMGDGGSGAPDTSVSVEARYIVGEYEVSVLSADLSDDLLTWLADAGYRVPESTADVLQEYIDGGSYFLAARVYPEAGLVDGDTLSPLQFAYDSDAFTLPIRIGTTSSKGEQDLIVYVVNDLEGGAVSIANYPELAVEDECMWDGEGDFSAFYAHQFAEAYSREDSAIWTTEYAWKNEPFQPKCDPCTAPPPPDQELLNLGFVDTNGGAFHFTRLHVRYTPDQATQDLVLYESRQTPQSQMRYIQYNEGLEDRFPLCGDGWAANPGTCAYTDPYQNTECLSEDERMEQCDRIFRCSGCTSSPGQAPFLLGLAVLVPLARRRR